MYLVAKEDDKFKLYCPDIFGLESWGTRRQVSLEKKRKYWYITTWSAGDDTNDNIEESIRLNVVLEATELEQVVNYIMKVCPTAIESILIQAQELYHERVAFENWAADRRNI